jgi:hypothetical protein
MKLDGRAVPDHFSLMANETYPVAPVQIDKALFAAMPEDLKRLQKQSRKELRLKAREVYKALHGISQPGNPLTNSGG